MVTINPFYGVSKKEGYNKKRVNEYNRVHQRRYGLNLHKKYDRVLIKWLEENKPYQETIKRLIREEIIRERKERRKLKAKETKE